MTVESAPAELTALALACRPGWTEREVRGVILAAHTAGWDWPRTLVEVARLVADPQAQPRQLLDQLRDPLRRAPARTAADVHTWVDHLRAQLPQREGDGT